MRNVERRTDILPLGAKAKYYFGTLDGEAGIQVWFIDAVKEVQTKTSTIEDYEIDIPILNIDPIEQKKMEEKLVGETTLATLWIADAGENKKALFGVR